MESLVRFLIGFVLIYQLLPMSDCKVIKQRSGHEKEISESEVNYERSNRIANFNSSLSGSQVELNKTSIKYTNATSVEALSGSDINSLTHISEENQIAGRSLLKFKKAAYSVKRSFKKIFYAWTYYGPEIGLCSCLFKYAWVTYPVVPEITYTAMGRARRFVSGFMQDFMQGFVEERSKDHHRISDKVAATTVDDYNDYQRYQVYSNNGPYRRNSNSDFADDLSQNAPLVEKSNPQLNSVVEMLKNLQPKTNVSDFVIRLARHLSSQPRKPNNVQQFRFVSDDGDEIRYFAKNHERDAAKASGNATKPAISEANESKVEGRSSDASNNAPVLERAYNYDPPPKGLPSYNELPPPDYSYYKNGIHHHVHDLRKNKSPVKGSGGWLKFDFEEAILSALGLSHPGRSIKPSVTKCSKIYAFNAILRFFQTALIG